jgi:hypothetical protein
MTVSRIIQQDFSAGMFRSVAAELIPENGAADIINGLLAEDGAVFRRGGTTYRSTTALASPATVLWDGTLAAGGQQTIIARSGGFHKMNGAGVLSSLGGAGVSTPGRAAATAGTVFMPGGATYNGTTLGTAAKVAPYYAIVAGRLLALNGDRLDFSNRDDPATFDATDFHLLPGGATGLGVVGLRDAALVFTTDGAWVISNMAYDLTDAVGNVQHRVDRYSGEIVLWGDAGIAPYAGGLIVPGNDAVWMVQLGIASEAPQAFTRISGPIDSLYREYVRAGYAPGVAAVAGGHYMLPILSGTDVADVLVCRLDGGKPAWSRLQGFGAQVTGFVRRVNPATRQPDLLASQRAGRIVNVGYLTPMPGTEADADGSTFSWSLTTRDYATGGYVQNTLMRLRASYRLVGRPTEDPSISAFLLGAPDVTSGTLWGQFKWGTGTWSPSTSGESVVLEQEGDAPPDETGTHPFSWRIVRRTRFARFRLRLDYSAQLSLRALEVIVRPSSRI